VDVVKVTKVLSLFCLLCVPASADLAAGKQAVIKGDYAAALREFLPLARHGDHEAQFNLGLMLDEGKGVPQDYQEAIKWYRLAAEQGDSDAQFHLGVIYAKGLGVPRNYVQAHMWYNLAGVSSQVSRRARTTLAQKMTTVQIAEAQRLARDWTAKTVGSGSVPADADTDRAVGTVASPSPVFIEPSASSTIPPRARSTGPARGVDSERAQSIQDAEDAGLVHTSYRSLQGSSGTRWY
jgi:uncharacterized protein